MNSENLISWYLENKRELPWRNTSNPYHIWISEIMLQQTKVEAVIPYYERFLELFPTIEELSQASDDSLHKAWEGLGYYSRVMNLKKAAIQCVELHHSLLPKTRDELLTLRGIGPYSAGAIASFAYHEKVAAVDGNVLRVYARLYEVEENILSDVCRKKITKLVEQDLPNDVANFNQAIMELGACICIPNGNARCNICPISSQCLAYEKGRINELPLRITNTKRRIEKHSVLVHVCNGKVQIQKRPSIGLLASLYVFEMIEGHVSKKDVGKSTYLGKHNHLFSHIEWKLKGFLIEHEQCDEKEGYIWVHLSEIQNIYPMPIALKKYRDALYEYYE